MKLRSLITLIIVLASAFASLSMGASASTNVPQATTSISYTMTATTYLSMVTTGALQVSFDSVQLQPTPPPTVYAFGVVAKTFPGFWITTLHWDFGDGAVLDVPYCCLTQISDTRWHVYAQPGSYTVLVAAIDNAGNSGVATVSVNWVTPIPEYPSYGLPLIASLLTVLFGAAALRKRIRHSSFPLFSR